MPLCSVGSRYYEDFMEVSDSFSDDLSRAETFLEREKVVSRFQISFEAYQNHVAQCLECNIDKREMK